MKTKISLDDGFNINMHVFGPEDGKPMLGLHGLMDNAASFDLLAPYLEGIRLYAIDLPGHGFSDFLPPYCEYTFDNLIPFIFKIADALGLKTFSIIGHSFGAIIGELCAAAIPDRIEKLVLLDIMGIRTASDEKIINAILDHIKRYQSPLPAHTLYQSLEHAVETRANNAFPVPTEVAELLVKAGTVAVPGGIRWTFDERLKSMPRSQFNKEQFILILNHITAKVCCILSTGGLTIHDHYLDKFIAAVANIEYHKLEGSHHFHTEVPEETARIINRFMA